MKLHRNLVYATVDTLHAIFNDAQYADKALHLTLKKDSRWGAKDRAFIAETTYDIIRWKRLYAEIALVKQPFSRETLFRLFAVWATLKGITLPDWPEFTNTPTRRYKGKFDVLSKIRRVRESIPDWMDTLCEEELGSKWDTELKALNKKAPVVLRVNTLKTTVKQLQKALAEEDITTNTLTNYPSALQLEIRKNVFQTESFKNGFFEVQDASSQLVAPFLDPKPGMRVVDACAGAGGKTLHLASLMQNKGQLIALDIYPSKLKQLKLRARRNGAHNIETRLIENNKTIKKLHGKADQLLLDAPCSGLGVLKRNPDSKWKLTPEFITKIKQTQQQLLQNYSKILKPGGTLVYATCSILPSENQQQIKTFLASDAGKNFTFVKDKTISVSKSGYDGFYMAKLQLKA